MLTLFFCRELVKRNLPTHGTKIQKMQRLEEALISEGHPPSPTAGEKKTPKKKVVDEWLFDARDLRQDLESAAFDDSSMLMSAVSVKTTNSNNSSGSGSVSRSFGAPIKTYSRKKKL